MGLGSRLEYDDIIPGLKRLFNESFEAPVENQTSTWGSDNPRLSEAYPLCFFSSENQGPLCGVHPSGLQGHYGRWAC